ncbi:MAG TPA: O-antigen ligase family protein [Acidimicrobiales bacterium]|nr:O-antigen ligase family protein [Acidimicrobiales bacterium]
MSRLHFLTQFLNHPSPANIAALVGLGVIVLGLCYLASRVTLAVVVAVGMFLELFSGSWAYMGIPVPIDRAVLLLGLAILVLKGPRFVSERQIVLRPLHIVILAAVAWAAASAIIAGTMFTKLGFYAFLDRFGLVPFALFCLAPFVFGSARQRNVFLGLMVAMGLYLSFTALLEGAHLYRLVVPSYIGDQNVGIQWGRARGPMLETTGNGFCIFVGAVGAATALRTWHDGRARALCYLTILLAFPAEFLTLTRGVWIGAFVGTVGALLLVKRTRRWVFPSLGVAGLAVVLALAVSPTLNHEAVQSADRQSSVWDRQNTDLAALTIVAEHPLTGIGWEKFITESPNFMVQQPGYPITGLNLEVHNVFLSHAAELGIPGLLLWSLGLAGAARRGLLPGKIRWRRPRRSSRSGILPQAAATPRPVAPQPGTLETMPEWWVVWRPAGLAIFLCFGVIASLAPFSEPLPNGLLWTWLGILAVPYTSRARSRAFVRAGSWARQRGLSLAPTSA